MMPTVPAPWSIERSAAWLVRGIGLVYAVAGASLWGQIIGLVGARGILPIAQRAGDATASFGAWWAQPSLLWFWPTDGALHTACAAVVMAGVALALAPGDRPRADGRAGARRWTPAWASTAAAVVAWAGYLSLVGVGDVFLGYQWDGLLCEAGFLTIWLSAALRQDARAMAAGGGGRSTRRMIWLCRLLVARLMFASGLVKLRGDVVWRDLSALSFHFMTQPLPTRAAWFAHHLPPGVLRAMTAGALAIELGAPLLVFGPRRARRTAAWLFIALQLAIGLTGNYGFFNVLTAVLCLSLLGDAAPVPPTADVASTGAPTVGPTVPPTVAPTWTARIGRALQTAVVITVLWLTITPLALAAGWRPSSPAAAPVVAPFVVLAPWRIVNPYGLFADMTTVRPEIVLEGTLDGRTWRPFPLRWLPSDVHRAPRLAGPHMPRLDWQLWFAALEVGAGGEAPGWLGRFLEALKRGDPSVVALVAADPFHGRRPVAVRAVLVDDRFSDAATRRRTGAWWVRSGGRVVAER